MRCIRDIDWMGKRALLRVDFNVPTDKNGEVLDDARIKATLPTITYLLDHGAAVIAMSHLGRPNGKPQEKFSLKRMGKYLQGLLKAPVIIANDCVGEEVRQLAADLKPGSVLLLENVRFHPEEEKNDPSFSKELAELGDVYVNDAFGTAHRAHSSTCGVADYLPAYAGLLMEKEVEMLNSVLRDPIPPRMAILGGAKVADKLALINNLLDRMDYILIGGGMANTFLQAQGKEIGRSLFEPDLINEAASILAKAANNNVKIMLPIDVVIAGEVSANAQGQIIDLEKMPVDKMIVDIGPKTVAMFNEAIMKAKTVVWNGPLGVYEYPQFSKGTREIALALAKSSASSVIGGGDSAAAIQDMGLEDSITHISTGGGATLEFLEGLQLPGVVACQEMAVSAY